MAHLNQDTEKIKELCGGQGFDDDAVKDLVLPLEHTEMNRLDNMKINTMEIIISFQQSVHVPVTTIINFVLGSE